MIVSTEELAREAARSSWMVFDCRHDLVDHARGRQLYASGHIAGAFFAPVETALSGTKTGRNGRHPLPEPQDMADFLAAHGVAPDKTVVAYDDAGGLYAARLWWLARWVGLRDVRLLDGGLTKWLSEGRALVADEPMPRPVPSWRARVLDHGVWSTAEVLRRLGDPRRLLIDARAPERFRGDIEPMDPVAGHIPGAINRFYRANLQPDLTFRPRHELRQEFAQLLGGREAAEVGHQCGSGITACANLFAMEYAGLPGSKLYAGSWSEWVADPSRPVERG